MKFIFGGIPEPPNSELTICWFLLRVYSFQYLYPRNPLAGHLVNRQLEVFKEYLDPSSVQHILRFETLASGLARHEDLYLLCRKNCFSIFRFQVEMFGVVAGAVVKRNSHWKIFLVVLQGEFQQNLI